MLMTLYLRCVRHQGGGDLSALLHALVLHRRDVLKPRGRHIPVQTGLAPLGRLLSTITTVPGSGPSTCDTMTPRILFFCSVLTSEKKPDIPPKPPPSDSSLILLIFQKEYVFSPPPFIFVSLPPAVSVPTSGPISVSASRSFLSFHSVLSHSCR